jgi:malonate decarboxylase alpha subunit
MLMSVNADIRNSPVTTWQRHREARDARIAAGSKLARGKIVEARDATRLMEAVVRPGDRVCLERQPEAGGFAQRRAARGRCGEGA